MISQELLTELTEAGFPFSTETGLSELIEACGEDMLGLNKCDEQSEEFKGNKWLAYGYGPRDKQKYCSGKTPEEAVANLWLALNKKDGPER